MQADAKSETRDESYAQDSEARRQKLPVLE